MKRREKKMNEIIDSIDKDNLIEKLDAFWHLTMTEEEMDKIIEKIQQILLDYPDNKRDIEFELAKWLLNHSDIKSPNAGGESNE